MDIVERVQLRFRGFLDAVVMRGARIVDEIVETLGPQITATTKEVDVRGDETTGPSKGDVSPAGEKFCEFFRKTSDGATLVKPNATSGFPKKSKGG